MPKFEFSATDRMGNTIEGVVDAFDMLLATEQIRRMGYAPTRVSVATQNAVVPAPVELQVTASMAAGGGGATAPTRPPLIDLTQPYVETPRAASATYDTQEAVPDTTLAMERMEPWERGGPIQQPSQQPTLAMNANGALGATQAMAPQVAADPVLPQNAPVSERSRMESVPYRAGVRRQVSFFQRFCEVLIYPLFAGVVLKDIVPFYRQFATLIGAGLSIHQALVGLEANTQNAKLKEVAREGQRQVQAGGRFSDVMAAYPWIFQPMQMQLVRAAETGGMLDQVLLQIASYVEHEQEIRRLINRETLYPKIVMFVALMIMGRPGFFGGMMSVVGLVLGKYSTGQYFADTLGFAFLCLAPFFILVGMYRLSLFNIPGIRELFDGVKLAIPGLGKLVRMFAIAKFMRTYSALYRGGFGMPECLRISGDASGNSVVQRAAHAASRQAERGGLASNALQASGFFPDMAVDMFRTGETTGNLDEMLGKVADFYEAEGKLKSHQLALVFSTVVFLIVAIFVGIQVISFYQGDANAMHAASEGQ